MKRVIEQELEVIRVQSILEMPPYIKKVNENANYVIVNSAYVVGCAWSIDDMKLSKDDDRYEEIKK